MKKEGFRWTRTDSPVRPSRSGSFSSSTGTELGRHHMRLAAKFVFLRQRLAQRGIGWAVNRLWTRVVANLVWIVFLPVTAILHVAGYRRLTIYTERIGHLAAEPDCFVKEKKLGRLPDRRWLLLAPPTKVANEHLLSYWEPFFNVVHDSRACWMLERMSLRWLMGYDATRYVNRLFDTMDMYEVNREWGSRGPVLQLSAEDASWVPRALEELGVPEGKWFVCVHFREPGFSPEDEAFHAHRNADISTVVPAVEEIVRRGGVCVRMGDPSMTPAPRIDGFLDYAHSPLKSQRMDVVLCAKAKFFLGSSSGLALVSTAFGVPCALANMTPLSCLAPLPIDISIPKILWSTKESRPLHFAEVMASPVADYRYPELYRQAGIEVRNNTPEEIRALVIEMLDRIDGAHVAMAEEEDLQRRFMELFRPGHYSYGAASRVGSAFLREYRHLLD